MSQRRRWTAAIPITREYAASAGFSGTLATIRDFRSVLWAAAGHAGVDLDTFRFKVERDIESGVYWATATGLEPAWKWLFRDIEEEES